MEIVNIIVYACDFDNGKAGIETRFRLAKALDFMRNSKPAYYDVFFGAGDFKQNDKVWSAKEIMYDDFTDMLYNCQATLKIREINHKRTHIFNLPNKSTIFIRLAKHQAWGSFKESEVCIEEMKNLGVQNNRTIIISSSYHIHRLKFIWKFMPVKKVKFISVDFHQSPKDKLLEPLRYVKALRQGLSKKFS